MHRKATSLGFYALGLFSAGKNDTLKIGQSKPCHETRKPQAVGKTKHMQLEQLERFEKLTAEDAEAEHWAALIALQPCLDNPFLELGILKFERGLPNRLASFRAPDDSLCYVAVTDTGCVVLGRLGDGGNGELRANPPQRLGDFDAGHSEVMSIAVTDPQRFAGDSLDLWIMALRHTRDWEAEARPVPSREYRLYHGIVSVSQEGKLLLRIPPDDGGTATPEVWRPKSPGKKVPAWLRRWNFSVDMGNIADAPSDIKAWLPSHPYAALDAIVWADGWLGYSMDRRLYFSNGPEKGFDISLELPGRAYCLTLRKIRDGVWYGFAGCDDRSLQFFELEIKDTRKPGAKEAFGLAITARVVDKFQWGEHPTALNLIERTDLPLDDGYAVYDLLVLDRSGKLAHLRITPQNFKRLAACWDHSAARLGLRSAEAILAQVETWLGQDTQTPEWKRLPCVTHAALEACLSEAGKATAGQRARWLESLLGLLKKFRRERNFPLKSLDRMIEAVEKYNRDSDHGKAPWHLPAGGDFRTALLYRLYQEELRPSDRRRVEVAASVREWEYLANDPWLICLREAITEGPWGAEEADDGVNPPSLGKLGRLLDAWDNVFTVNAITPLPRELRGKLRPGQWALVQRLDADGKLQTIFLLAEGRLLHAGRFDHHQKILSFGPIHTNGQAIECLLALPDGHLAWLEGDNESQQRRLRVLRLVEQGNLALKDVAEAKPLPVDGFSNLICHCPGPAGTVYLAVLVNQGRIARLSVFQWTGSELNDWTQQTVEVPWAHAADLAYDGAAGFRLIAATDQSPMTRLYYFDGMDWSEERSFDIFKRGANAVAFGVSWVASGSSSGNLWCANLPQGERGLEIRWTARLSAPVSFLRPLFSGSGEQESLLAGTSTGELCLFRAKDGCRLWRRQLQAWLDDGAYFSAERLAIVLGRDMGFFVLPHLFSQERDEVLQSIKGELKQLAANPPTSLPSSRVFAPARAVYEFQSRHRNAESLLELPERDARAVLLRFLVETGQVGTELPAACVERLALDEVEDLLPILSDCDPQTSDRLWRRLKPIEQPDEAAANALATLLLDFATRQPSIEQVLGYVPIRYMRYYWVERKAARLLLEAGKRQMRTTRGTLFPILFPALLRWSVNVALERLPSLASPLCKEYQPLQALAVLLEVGAHSPKEIGLALQELETALSSPDASGECNRLFVALLRFHRCFLSNRPDAPWGEWRRRGLDGIAQLIAAIPSAQAPDAAITVLVEPLRAWLGHRSPPEDCASRGEQLRWLEPLRQHHPIGTLAQAGASMAATGWDEKLRQALECTRHRLTGMLENEYKYQLALLRPRLEALEILRLENNRLRVRLRSKAEADSRVVDDVTLIFQCGLLPPGQIEARQDYQRYPSQLNAEEWEFDGFLPAGQTDLSVTVTLRAGTGYCNETVWRFPLPKIRKAPHRQDWHPALDRIYQDFRAHLLTQDAPLLMVGIDPSSGYQPLLNDWDDAAPGHRIDLDECLREIGPGRRYGNRVLDAEALLEPVAGQLCQDTSPPAGKPKASTWVLAPMDETLERLFLADDTETVKTWLHRLRQRWAESTTQRLRLIVSTRHAARLRALGVAGLDELALHRHLLGRDKRGLRTAVVDWIMEACACEPQQAIAWLDALGWDLRLVTRWLKIPKTHGQARDFQIFLEADETHAILREDLHSLNVFELTIAMAGSVSLCHVPLHKAVEGLYAGTAYHSTVREKVNVQKTLQRPGTIFSAASLAQLRADAQPPDRVRVQGFGIAYPSESSETGLLPMLMLRPRELEGVFCRLDELGIGLRVGGVFRTAAPYRDYLAGLYTQEANTAAKDRQVFLRLAGTERDPSELLRPADLSSAVGGHLDKLLPTVTKLDRDALRSLALAWQATAGGDTMVALRRLFTLDEVTRPERKTGRWDEALLSLGIPCFGMGRIELRAKLATSSDPAYQDTRASPGDSEARDYLYWLAEAVPFDFAAFSKQVGESLTSRSHWLDGQAYEADYHVPKFILTGPGVETLLVDPARQVAVWRFADYTRAAWRGGLMDGLWARAKAQLRLTSFSPYRTSGGLPPGSPLFVGRKDEMEFIHQRLPQASILIVGCRRVGKTSLLNQVFHELQGRAGIEPIYLDLQGVAERKVFLRLLLEREGDLTKTLRKMGLQDSDDPRIVLEKAAKALQRQGKQAVFLLNEVDALAKHDPEMLDIFRGLNDQGLARFLFVGYAVIRGLGGIDNPLFHFTEGRHFGGKAISLAELSPAAAERLLGLLEAPPLGLRWRTDEDRGLALALLLERSYRIPWVLQRYGQLLVEHLERERREELCLEDVNRLLREHGQVVWQYISQIDYASLGYADATKAAHKPGFLIILYALARKFYFQGGDKAPIRDLHLNGRRALDLGFRLGEVVDALRESVHGLLREREQQAFMRWFDELDLSQALKLLTLTLILEPDPMENERYGFLLHIFPLELYRMYGKVDPTLDDLIIRTTEDFLRTMPLGEMK